MIGWPEIIIGLFIILLLFGASRIPKLARGFGEGVSEFKKGLKEGEEEVKSEDQEQSEIPAGEGAPKDADEAKRS